MEQDTDAAMIAIEQAKEHKSVKGGGGGGKKSTQEADKESKDKGGRYNRRTSNKEEWTEWGSREDERVAKSRVTTDKRISDDRANCLEPPWALLLRVWGVARRHWSALLLAGRRAVSWIVSRIRGRLLTTNSRILTHRWHSLVRLLMMRVMLLLRNAAGRVARLARIHVRRLLGSKMRASCRNT